MVSSELVAAIVEKLVACGAGVMFGVLGYRLLSLRRSRMSGGGDEGDGGQPWWEVLPGMLFGTVGGVVIVLALWRPLPESPRLAEVAYQPQPVPRRLPNVPPAVDPLPDLRPADRAPEAPRAFDPVPDVPPPADPFPETGEPIDRPVMRPREFDPFVPEDVPEAGSALWEDLLPWRWEGRNDVEVGSAIDALE